MNISTEYCLQALAWKEREDYTEGLRLFRQRYGETIVYRALCLATNDFNRTKLRTMLMDGVKKPEIPTATSNPKKRKWRDEIEQKLEELEDAVGDLSIQIEDQASERESTPITIEKPENEPQEVAKMRQTTYGLMDERIALKQRLRELPDPSRRADRKDTALRILAITDELDLLFAKIDYYQEFGRVPEMIAIEPDVVMFPKEYTNLRTYVSRTMKKLLKETDPAKKAELNEQIQKWKERMNEIETEL